MPPPAASLAPMQLLSRSVWTLDQRLRIRRSTSSLLVHATAFAATAIEDGAQGSLTKIHPT
jgi:hypothetical protein